MWVATKKLERTTHPMVISDPKTLHNNFWFTLNCHAYLIILPTLGVNSLALREQCRGNLSPQNGFLRNY